METIIQDHHRVVLYAEQNKLIVRSELFGDVSDLIEVLMPSIQYVHDVDTLCCLLASGIFNDSDDEMEPFDFDTKYKAAVVLLNVFSYLIEREEGGEDDIFDTLAGIEEDEPDFEVSWEPRGGVFYPTSIGCWYFQDEMVLMHT